ncbi:armadillo-type protein [Paraphoma chrysanthemicola]|uniref:Armadillo-type protein n=1 Tax=Paraphoma chrysanthemicola TaxID=798071 RepID=A0A8K0VVG1_9PLEO|nr:armadillo-type protein [Paraphoma chrysanthemicola]
MAAMSRGFTTKPASKLRAPKRAAKRVKGGTESTRNHTFKGFSQRITQLKIEPVRRGRSTILDDAELESTFSYFRDAFLEWRELNLSEGFSIFARRVASLCDSLPQVLHHSDRIMELLIEYIQKGDKFSEEPLLSLLAHLAHDLGERFEKHFEQAVTVVSRLAATHADVEVIEWSFGCLAWLFKYLSRLLVPDLRPVFDLISPLLGKARQKAFVSRFAAESLSFLVRKAGSGYHRDRTPLQLIIKHISEQLEDMQGSAKDYEFQHGLMYLLADSLKGVQRGFHSSAAAIVQELLNETYSENHSHLRTPPLQPVVIGVLTAAIHHTDAENFEPLLSIILSHIQSASSKPQHAGVSSRMLFAICGVRQGDRIAGWKPVVECLSLVINSVQENQADTSIRWEALSAVSVVFQYCSMDAAVPHEKLLEKVTQGQWENHFLSFCNLFASLGAERFQTLLLPYFKKFVIQKAHNHASELCVVLPKLYENVTIAKSTLHPSEPWQQRLLEPFQQITDTSQSAPELERLSYQCNALLDSTIALSIKDEHITKLRNLLGRLLTQALGAEAASTRQPVHLFALGAGLHFFVEHSDGSKPLAELWPKICQASETFGHSVSFWRALLVIAKRENATLALDGRHIEILKRSLIHCLGSSSHELRLTALQILDLLVGKDDDRQRILSVAMLIEQTPLTLEHQRSIAMRIGQLAKHYPSICSDDWIGEAIPAFCFGLLQVRLSSVWDDTCSALKSMCETKEGENFVTRTAFEWLDAPETDAQQHVATPNGNSASRPYVTEFECTNVVQLESVVCQSQELAENVEDRLRIMFEEKHAQVPFLNSFSRGQALRLLNTLPQIAEKRSRLLVPILLNWALNKHADGPQTVDNEEEETSIAASHGWARKDQKAMLSLFAKFGNPKVLYRSGEVRDALLALLANGDLEIQKAALQALLTWKDPGIVPYKEDLLNLLDDARFRDELPIFLSEGEIQDTDLERLLPIVLRLLYGKVIAGKRGLESKRKAVFIGLKTRFGDNAIRQFLDIAFGPLSGISVMNHGGVDNELIQKDVMDSRKQVGLLNMLDDLLSTFQTTFNPFIGIVIDPTLYCLIKASRILSNSEPLESEDLSSVTHGQQMSLLKTIRQRAIHILARLTENCPEFSWQLYSSVIVKELVEPRLQNLPIETAQSVSGLLRLFAAWAKSSQTAPFLVESSELLLPKVIDCLEVPSAKDEVKIFILNDILGGVIGLVGPHGSLQTSEEKLLRNRIHTDIIQPYANLILVKVGSLLRQSPSKEVLEAGVQTIAELASHVVGTTESRSMLEIATFLLRQPSKRVSPRTKLGLLKILHEFIQRYDSDAITELFDSIFDSVCPMFAFIQDKTARSLLCDILHDLSESRDDLVATAALCQDLNSFATSRLDEPDFERRSRAFNKINDTAFRSYTLVQWKPLIYNMLFLVKDQDELSIRTNASLSLRRFIEVSQSDDLKGFILAAVLPGIHNGMRESSELVRAEFLAVLEQLVRTQREWAPVADLYVLLSEDEEASFFSNVLHIQGHRRLRALRRLAANASRIKSGNIYHIMLPLLEHFVFNKADDEGADSLSGETIKSITSLVEWIEWPQLRALLKRYIGYLSSKEDKQKAIIKLIVGSMEGLNRAGRAKGYVTTASVAAQVDNDAEEEHIHNDSMDLELPISSLTRTLPQQDKLTGDLINNFLPDLVEYLHKKDDTTVSLRVPVAIAITKVLLVLPPHEIESRLPGVLLDICYILKSRAQESRDMARNTLSDIATFMGPAYLGFIIKALRTALQRGYQLHVLSFTIHHILVKLSDQLNPGDLDYCLSDIVDVVMDDTFGITGQEKDAEEYISKMKEVKSSKSFDSMDIVARSATPTHLIRLVTPIKSLLLEKLNARMVQKIDELLRRIGLGILQNPTVNDRDILVFCYELIQEVYRASATTETKSKIDPKNKRYLINMRGAAKSGARLSTSSYVYKLTRFSLDILRTVLRKHTELQTPQNLAGFLPVIGDAMVQGQEEVQVSAIRLLATFIKMPMTELDTNCPVYVDEAIRAIKGAPSSNTELAQASLKLISAVLRDRPNVDIKDRDIGHLIKRLVPDLDEPDRQGVSFGFLKAVMNRRFDLPEMYEAMDKVAEMMITNHTKSARDVARSHYFQFLTSYTQSEKRFKKQLEFLLKNLRYEHMEGRQSVMDALDLVITKALPRFPEKAQYDYHGMLFLPLVNSVANDDSSKCRAMASLLVKSLFQYASDRRLQSFTADLKSWLGQDENAGLRRLGIQCWGFYFEAIDEDADDEPKDLPTILAHLDTIIDESLARRDDDDWELLYYSLTLLSKVCKKYPDSMFASTKESLWTAVQVSASYPHAWVKLKAAELLGTYFAHLGISNKDNGLDTLPLEGSGGLQLAEQSMIQLTNAFLNNLLNQDVSEQLCMQSVKNIAFLARCFAVNEAKWHWQRVEGEGEDEDDAASKTNGATNGYADASDEEFGGFSPPPGTPSKKTASPPPAAIHRLMIRLSGLVRRDNRSMLAKTSTMHLLETIAIKLPLEALASSLPHLLTTLNTLIDPATTIPRSHTTPTSLNEPNEEWKALIDKAREIMNALQKRMGTQEYLNVMGEVQKAVRERREERRRKRKVEALIDPEKAEKEKRRRHDVKRVKRKEKGAEGRSMRRGW